MNCKRFKFVNTSGCNPVMSNGICKWMVYRQVRRRYRWNVCCYIPIISAWQNCWRSKRIFSVVVMSGGKSRKLHFHQSFSYNHWSAGHEPFGQTNRDVSSKTMDFTRFFYIFLYPIKPSKLSKRFFRILDYTKQQNIYRDNFWKLDLDKTGYNWIFLYDNQTTISSHRTNYGWLRPRKTRHHNPTIIALHPYSLLHICMSRCLQTSACVHTKTSNLE